MQTKAYLVNLREINKEDMQISSTNISSISLPTSTPLFKSVKQWVGQTLTNIIGRITSTIVHQAAAETPLRPVANPDMDVIDHMINSVKARRVNIAESSEENSENNE